jgi:hypothetical protein
VYHPPGHKSSTFSAPRWSSNRRPVSSPATPLSLEDAQRVVARYVEHYNTPRLHSAIGYLTPVAKLEGRAQAIFADRDRKLKVARERRKQRRQAQRPAALDGQTAVPTT